MANNLLAIMPKVLAAGLVSLRENATMLRTVNMEHSTTAAQKGETINIPVPQPMVATAVTPSNVLPNPSDITPTTVDIKLDQWYESKFKLSDKDKGDIEASDSFIPQQTSEAARALANKINDSVFAEYLGVYGFVDYISNGPFHDGSSVYSPNAAISLRSTLSKQLCPDDGNRRLVMDFTASANALRVGAFSEMQKSGMNEMIIRGQLGTRMGFDLYEDHAVPLHTAGTITTGLIAKAATAVAAGVTSLVATTAASTGACDLKKGDIILIDGDTQSYVLTADAEEDTAATDVTLSFQPPLKVALTGSEAITVEPSHRVNLGFHRDAFALAMRPLSGTSQGLGSVIMAQQDPKTGIILRLEVDRQHKQESWSFDALWGVKLVRPELAARLAGAAS